jgi:uncharacterized membrane protein YccC
MFSLKTFLSLLLTLYIAFDLDLEKPYWAALTVYIVALPLSGALRSKATYRFLGTVLGAAFCLVLIPGLVNSPELLSLGLAAWIGLCLYISLLDRSPRSYVFMLAGYTASFVALPAVADPANIFSAVVARIEEISLAIVCTSVVDSVIFPTSMKSMLTSWSGRCEQRLREWAIAAFRGERYSRVPLAMELGQTVRLANILAYEPSHLSQSERQLNSLQARILVLLPALSSIDDRIRELKRLPDGIPADIQSLLDDAQGWSAKDQVPREDLDRLRKRIKTLTPSLNGASNWTSIVVSTLLVRLREALELLQDCRSLRDHLAKGTAGSAPRLVHFVPHAARAQHVDHGMALWSGLATAVAIYFFSLTWIFLAWPEGAIAVQMAAVGCCFFATLDDPAPMIRSFAYQQLPGFLVGIVYVYAVLPQVSGFEMLALVLAPTYLLAGAMIPEPALYGWGLGLAESTTMTIAYRTTFGADFATTINNDIATLVGISGAAAITGLIRSVGSAWSTTRLRRANQREIVELTRQSRTGTAEAAARRSRLTAIMMDRLSQLILRSANSESAEKTMETALARLRISLNIVDIQRLSRGMPAVATDVISELMSEIGTYIATLNGREDDGQPPSLLLVKLDEALAVASAGLGGTRDSLLMTALVGIRRGFFPLAPPYRAPNTP